MSKHPKTFQAIQLSISTQFSSIRPIDRTLSGSSTPGQSGSGSDGNKGLLCILQSITGTSPSDRLVSYPGYSLEKSYSSAANWSPLIGGGFLTLCKEAVDIFYWASEDINQKMNLIEHLEFELTYYDFTVQHISFSANGSPLN